MPPKRKQVDDSAPDASSSTRSTRSTRASAAASSSGAKKKGSAKHTTASSVPLNTGGDEESDMEPVHSAKKARKSGSASNLRKAAAKGKHANRKAGEMEIDEKEVHTSKVSVTKELPSVGANHHQPVVPPIPAVPVASTKSQPPIKKPSLKAEPYSSQHAQELFKIYADSDDPNVIGPEGFEQLCNDADLPLEGARPIIFAWQFGAKEMAKITKEEWIHGTSSLKISNIPVLTLAISELEDLLIHGKPAVKTGPKKDQEYDRSSYLSCAADAKAGFQKLYQFCFTLAKPEASRNIEMETSVAFWTVLLVPKFPIMKEVLEFISEKGSYKATNKDLWTMMLEFCQTIKPSLQDYEADGAWPTLLDDFVIWKKCHSSNGNAGDMDVDH